MTCSACGGDGLIEVGAYRGDEGGETRECRLCGGAITTDAPLEQFARAATQAGVSVYQVSQVLQSGDFQRAARIANEYTSQPPREPRSPKSRDSDTLQRADGIRSKWNRR